MNDLTKLCDDLEHCQRRKAGVEDEIVCVKSKLKCYIGEDYNKILKLKVQLKIYNSNSNIELGMISLIVSVITLCITALGNVADNIPKEYVLYCFGSFVTLLIVCVLFSWGAKKYGYRNKWKRYIEVTLEDIEKEYEKKSI